MSTTVDTYGWRYGRNRDIGRNKWATTDVKSSAIYGSIGLEGDSRPQAGRNHRDAVWRIRSAVLVVVHLVFGRFSVSDGDFSVLASRTSKVNIMTTEQKSLCGSPQ